MAAKRGRPPLPPDERRASTLGIRLTAEEREALELMAEQAGKTVTDLILDATIRKKRSSKKA